MMQQDAERAVYARPKAAYTARQCECSWDLAWLVAIPVFFVASLAAMITCAVFAGIGIVDCPVATCNVTDAVVQPVRFTCVPASGAVLVDQPAGPVYAYTPGRAYRAVGCALTVYGGRTANTVDDGQFRVWPYLAWQTAYVLDDSAAQPGAQWTPVTADDAAALGGATLALRTISGVQCMWAACVLAVVAGVGAIFVAIVGCVCAPPCCRRP